MGSVSSLSFPACTISSWGLDGIGGCVFSTCHPRANAWWYTFGGHWHGCGIGVAYGGYHWKNRGNWEGELVRWVLLKYIHVFFCFFFT